MPENTFEEARLKKEESIQRFTDSKTEQIIKTSAFNGAIELISNGYDDSKIGDIAKLADKLEVELRNRINEGKMRLEPTTALSKPAELAVEPQKLIQTVRTATPTEREIEMKNEKILRKSFAKKLTENEEEYRSRLEFLAEGYKDKPEHKLQYSVVKSMLEAEKDPLPF